jgi:hypothetical protein
MAAESGSVVAEKGPIRVVPTPRRVGVGVRQPSPPGLGTVAISGLISSSPSSAGVRTSMCVRGDLAWRRSSS